MNIIQGYFGEKKPGEKRIDSLEAGEVVIIDSGNWDPIRFGDNMHYKPDLKWLFDKFVTPDKNANPLLKFLNQSRWEVVLVAGENAEVRYLGPRIGEKESEDWIGQSFFVKTKFLKKI